MTEENINHDELWLYEDPEILASVKRGLEDAKQGRVKVVILDEEETRPKRGRPTFLELEESWKQKVK